MKKGRPPVYLEITYEELGYYIGKKGVVKVSKAWLDPLMGNIEEPSLEEVSPVSSPPQEKEKIDYKITTFS